MLGRSPRIHSHSLLLCLPPEVRNAIYRFAIGRGPANIIESMDYLDGLQAQVVLLQVCREMYLEAIPVVLANRELVLGGNKFAGHGKRMRKVLDRIVRCPLAGHIVALAFKVENGGAVLVGAKTQLCRRLSNMIKQLQGLRGLRRIKVTYPNMWGKQRVKAFRVRLEQELCKGLGTRVIEVEICGSMQ